MSGNASSPSDLARRAALVDFGPEVAAWLADGFRRHVVDGLPIETALRLDRVSRRAAALLTVGSDGAWPVAVRLAP